MFHEARAPTGDELQALLAKIIRRILKCLTRQGYLIEEEGMSYLADTDADHALTPLQAASCSYRIALGPRAGQKVLSLQTVPSRAAPSSKALCANAHGFSRTGDKSLHAGVRCGADQRKALEHLCRYITRPAIANERSFPYPPEPRPGAGNGPAHIRPARTLHSGGQSDRHFRQRHDDARPGERGVVRAGI